MKQGIARKGDKACGKGKTVGWAAKKPRLSNLGGIYPPLVLSFGIVDKVSVATGSGQRC